MLPIFLKELRQFRRSTGFFICIISILLAVAAIIFRDNLFVRPMNAVLFFSLISILTVLSESALRWRNELSDPAFSPAVTTPLPPYILAAGKLLFTAALLYLIFFIFIVLAAAAYGLTYKIAPGDIPERFISNFEYIFNMSTLLWAVAAVTALSLGFSAVCSKVRHKTDVIFVILLTSVLLMASAPKMSFIPPEFLLYSVLAGFFLMYAGVSPANTNRLLPLKLLTVAFIFIMPCTQSGKAGTYAEQLNILFISGIMLFFFSALFERTVQSRRVLKELKSPFGALLFPISTGALNSLANGIIMLLIYLFLMQDNSMWYPLLLQMTAASAAIALSILCEKKFSRRIHPVIMLIIINFVLSVTVSTFMIKLSASSFSSGKVFTAAAFTLTAAALTVIVKSYFEKRVPTS